jgi:hypothetical protein
MDTSAPDEEEDYTEEEEGDCGRRKKSKTMTSGHFFGFSKILKYITKNFFLLKSFIYKKNPLYTYNKKIYFFSPKIFNISKKVLVFPKIFNTKKKFIKAKSHPSGGSIKKSVLKFHRISG